MYIQKDRYMDKKNEKERKYGQIQYDTSFGDKFRAALYLSKLSDGLANARLGQDLRARRLRDQILEEHLHANSMKLW